MNKIALAIIPIIVIAAIAAYALSPYFTESTIDEALPPGAIIQPSQDDTMMDDTMDDTMMDDTMDDTMMDDTMDDTMMDDTMDDTMMDDTMDDTMMDDTMDDTMMDDTMDDTMMDDTMNEETMLEDTSIPMTYAGTFIGVDDGIHDAEGDVYTIPLENGSDVLRLENFRSTNGPDLYVYLATDDRATDFINLGELRANQGNQNYDIPADADLTKYNNVLIWCKAFSVLFGSAEILPQS